VSVGFVLCPPPLDFCLCLKLHSPLYNTQCSTLHALENARFTDLIKTLLVLTKNLLELKSFQHYTEAGKEKRTMEGLVNSLAIDFC